MWELTVLDHYPQNPTLVETFINELIIFVLNNLILSITK